MVQGRQRHVAAYAKDFLFVPDQLRQPVAALSGGERNRLTLAIALAQSTDVLVLDEPTNDLDMQTLDLLEDMLLNFEGTLILVSHDRAFLDATVTSCLVPLGDGKWVETAGGWTDAQSQIKGKPGRAKAAEPKAKKSKPQPAPPKKQTKLSFKDQHRLQEVETLMPKLETEIGELETKLADPNLFNDDPDAFNRINTRLEAARAELEQAEMDWMEIEEKKEALAG
jgi:ATP-binding cassette subfamily F protein uup